MATSAPSRTIRPQPGPSALSRTIRPQPGPSAPSHGAINSSWDNLAMFGQGMNSALNRWVPSGRSRRAAAVGPLPFPHGSEEVAPCPGAQPGLLVGGQVQGRGSLRRPRDPPCPGAPMATAANAANKGFGAPPAGKPRGRRYTNLH
jgi:hypothetical protein